MSIAGTASTLRIAGILRAYFSLASFHGWALVPPQQHGGFSTARLTLLNLDEATQRQVVVGDGPPRIRFARGEHAVFELERDDAIFTPPPRATREGRYLYVGGRRRTVPEPWMLQ
jgi:hypothetical protein